VGSTACVANVGRFGGSNPSRTHHWLFKNIACGLSSLVLSNGWWW